MDERIYSAKGISAAALRQALEDPRLRWVYGERMEDIVLITRTRWLDQEITLEHWHHGRAFAPALELSWWQRNGERYEVRAITAGDPPTGIDWDLWESDWDSWQPDATIPWLLVGEHDTDRESDRGPSWSVARIPRYLYYPVPELDAPSTRVAAQARAYRQQGMITLHRLLEVKGVETDDL